MYKDPKGDIQDYVLKQCSQEWSGNNLNKSINKNNENRIWYECIRGHFRVIGENRMCVHACTHVLTFTQWCELTRDPSEETKVLGQEVVPGSRSSGLGPWMSLLTRQMQLGLSCWWPGPCRPFHSPPPPPAPSRQIPESLMGVSLLKKLFGPYKYTILSSESYTLFSSSQLNLRFVYFLNGNLRGTVPAR